VEGAEQKSAYNDEPLLSSTYAYDIDNEQGYGYGYGGGGGYYDNQGNWVEGGDAAEGGYDYNEGADEEEGQGGGEVGDEEGDEEWENDEEEEEEELVKLDPQVANAISWARHGRKLQLANLLSTGFPADVRKKEESKRLICCLPPYKSLVKPKIHFIFSLLGFAHHFSPFFTSPF
jgi:hypothetical protein